MDAEQYKEFEQRLKFADDYEHPVPDEKAWEAMCVKLDNAFGKERKRRVIWLILMPTMVLMIPAVLLLTKRFNHSPDNFLSGKATTAIRGIGLPENAVNNNEASGDRKGNAPVVLNKQKGITSSLNLASYQTRKSQPLSRNEDAGNREEQAVQSRFTNTRETRALYLRLNGYKERVDLRVNQDGTNSAWEPSNLIVNHMLGKQVATPISLSDDSGKLNPVFNTARPSQRRNKGLGKIYLTASLSPNKSFASSGNGKWATAYGGSIGYMQGKRWFIEAGVHTGKALYNAGPKEYKWEGAYGYELKSLEANCLIIDLPIVLGYTIYHKRGMQIFSTVGVSSQLMKEENYDYTAARDPVDYQGTLNYKNKNKHLFSSAQVGVGMSYKVSNGLTFRAAPYFKKSLKGVGEGEVRLNSSGINLGLQVFPFHQRNH